MWTSVFHVAAMKYKSRLVIVTFIAIFTFTVIVLLVQDAVEDDADLPDGTSHRKSRYYDKGLGYIQGKIEDTFGYRKVVKNPDLSLKSVDDLESQMRQLNKRNPDASDSINDADYRDTKTLFDPAVQKLLQQLDEAVSFNFSMQFLQRMIFKDYVVQHAKKRRQSAPRLSTFERRQPGPTSPNHYRFFYGIRKYSLYDPEDPAVDGLLHDMATAKIIRVDIMPRGTELKLMMEFDNRYKAVFKPMRWGRDYETLPNHFYFNDFERHHAEIAAFHLDRLMGFYSVPPVTGRLVNVTKEIFLLTGRTLKKTFYVSPVGNICFYGECTYYCDSRHSFCGEADMIEGSLMAYLPTDRVAISKWKSPWRRSYSKFRRASWENDDMYCTNHVKKDPGYRNTKLLLDTIDSAVFDFLTGNMDRHHTEVWTEFGNNSFVLRMDNGRGFGKTKVDEFSIIAPLQQCCVIRQSTFLKLAKLYTGPERLSSLIDASMKRDPLYPILTDKHLEALDRRVVAILRIVSECVAKTREPNAVILDDLM